MPPAMDKSAGHREPITMIVMSSKPQRSGQTDHDQDDDRAGASGKTVIRVKRGALRRFDQLTRKSANLPVEVKWDRRTTDRRSESSPENNDRRRRERRQKPPFTWDAADFLVEGDYSKKSDDDGN
jgi:hypothetical protein